MKSAGLNAYVLFKDFGARGVARRRIKRYVSKVLFDSATNQVKKMFGTQFTKVGDFTS